MPHADTYRGFHVRVDLADGKGPVAGFHEVSGLGVSVTVTEFRAGGDPDSAVRKLPGAHKTSDVTLTRGLVSDLSLWTWINGDPPEIRDVSLSLVDEEGRETLRYVLHRAWPCRWEQALHAGHDQRAVEVLVLAVERLEVIAG